MTTIPFVNVQGHIMIVVDNKRILIDTGSPVTIGNEECELVGMHIIPHNQILGHNIENIRSTAGFTLDILLGMDYLSQQNIQIRYNDCAIDFGDYSPATTGIQKPMSNFMNQCVIFPVVINGIETNAIFDTGAPLAYINPKFVQNKAATIG